MPNWCKKKEGWVMGMMGTDCTAHFSLAATCLHLVGHFSFTSQNGILKKQMESHKRVAAEFASAWYK
ncbi:hypothetical protein F2Q69_00039693 [Brassica cretica]|uniref:Uncharacterized protein n=1 Tax=Brassica cretica TaxID=69181 RepID=A0A8S9NGN3_BRACR|nr:hypothetical protein F2Q69_00039693 [Brassica cretica]